jgi:uncharacterized caspase-like protein
MEMTVPRVLLILAIFLGLLSTSLGKVVRVHELRTRPARTPSLPEDFAPNDANRLALVIGNSKYPDGDSPLTQVSGDANALAKALRKDGFLVDVVDNTTRLDMRRAIDRLEASMRSNSIVFVYFGGYGIQSHGQNHLIPVDAKIWREKDVRREGVGIDRLLSGLRASGARVQLLVIEASRRNPYERRFRTYSHGLASIHMTKNMLTLSSAAPGEVIEDSDGSQSQLMIALLREMNSPRGIEEVFRQARNAVNARTQGRQVPALSSTLSANVNLWPARKCESSIGSAAIRRRG